MANWIAECANDITRERFYEKLYSCKVLSFNGHIVTASSIPANIGSLCNIHVGNGLSVNGEIVAVSKDYVEILPYDANSRIRVGNEVLLIEDGREVYVGDDLLGRVIDGLGNPLDQLGEIKLSKKWA